MKSAVLLWLVCLGVSLAAPVEEGGPQAASCTDPAVLGAMRQAMDKINKDRTEGYVFSLYSQHNLTNAHIQKHGENNIMFYLTMNVLETDCPVISKAHFKDCSVRDIASTPVYGQCKVAIFISRVNRVSRLYKYNCVVRPAAALKVNRICPDCPSLTHDINNAEVQKRVALSLEKFNKESGLSNYFALLQVTRASSTWMMGPVGGMMYFVEYTIQETTCVKGPEKPDECPLMNCEFAHKGFCKASFMPPRPILDIEEDGAGAGAGPGAGAGAISVDCKIYESEAAEKAKTPHQLGGETDHSHSHTHGTNLEQGQDHSHSSHHHLHPHEHHHGQDQQQTTPERRPEGVWRQTPPLGVAVTLPAFPDVPAGPEAGVTLPSKPDPQIPGQMEPTVGPFPTEVSADCPPIDDDDFVAKLFVDDPEFTVGS